MLISKINPKQKIYSERKKEVEANKTAGIDTTSAEEAVRNQKFWNDVNEAVGVGKKANPSNVRCSWFNNSLCIRYIS